VPASAALGNVSVRLTLPIHQTFLLCERFADVAAVDDAVDAGYRFIQEILSIAERGLGVLVDD
jgi:hypothetical protein